MQVSYNAIIREMDAEELQEEFKRVQSDTHNYDFINYLKMSDNIDRQYQQLTGKSLITQQTK